MDAWLTHLGAIERTRPATRLVVGRRAEAVQGPSFETHLQDAMSEPGTPSVGQAATASWGELYCREAGLLLTMPTSVPVIDEEEGQQSYLKRVDPSQAA